MADNRRGRALKQLQLPRRQKKRSGEGAEKGATQKVPDRKRRGDSTATAGRENRIMKGAGLGDLRPEDRQRLRQLIEDLALAESEKEEVEEKLKRERKDHDQQLSVLRARQFALFKDKGELEHKVKSLQQGRQQQNSIAQSRQSHDQHHQSALLHSQYKRQQILLEHQQHLHQVQKQRIEQQLQQMNHLRVDDKSSVIPEDRLKNDENRHQGGSDGATRELYYGGNYLSWSRNDPLSTHRPTLQAVSNQVEQPSCSSSDSMCSLPQLGKETLVNTKPHSVYQQPTQTSYNPSNVTFPSSIVQEPTTQLLPNPATMVPRPTKPTPPFLIHQADNTALLSAATSLESVTSELFTRPVTRKTAKVVEPSSESCTTTSISSSYLSSPTVTHEVSVQVTALESISTQTDMTHFEPASSDPLPSTSLSIPSSTTVTHEVSVQVTGLENVSTQTDDPENHPHTTHCLPHLSHNLAQLQSTENDLEATLSTGLKAPTKHSSPIMNSPSRNPATSPTKNSSTASSGGDRSSVTLGDSLWRRQSSSSVIVPEVKDEDISLLLNQGCHGVDALTVVHEARVQDSLPSETDDEELLEELFFVSTNER